MRESKRRKLLRKRSGILKKLYIAFEAFNCRGLKNERQTSLPDVIHKGQCIASLCVINLAVMLDETEAVICSPDDI